MSSTWINSRQIYSYHFIAKPKWRPCCLWIVTVLFSLAFSTASATSSSDSTVNEYFTAKVNMTYFSQKEEKFVSESKQMGHYVKHGKLGPETAKVIHVMTKKNKSDGCTDLVNAPVNEKWIALIERGDCKFSEKLKIAQKFNACAVVFYNNETTKNTKTLYPNIQRSIGKKIIFGNF